MKILVTAVAYLLITGLGAWRIYAALLPFLPWLSLPGYLAAVLVACALLPLSFALPRCKAAKALSVAGNLLVCFQFLFFFAALCEWVLMLVLVRLLGVFNADGYARFALVFFAGVGLLTLYGILHARRVKLTRYAFRFPKPGLPEAGLRIVQLSDLHLGSVNDLGLVRKLVDQVHRLAPDLVCITGDTFTENTRDLFEPEAMAEALGGLQGRYGTFACLGNHDAGAALPAMMGFFAQAGIRVLEDQSLDLGPFVLLGRADPTPGETPNPLRKAYAECMAHIDTKKLVVAMDHQPGDLEGAQEAGVDLLLCGHTHGGQFFPANLLIRRVFPHYRGAKAYGQMQVVVSAGSGAATPPVRLGSDAEIVEITLFGGEA